MDTDSKEGLSRRDAGPLRARDFHSTRPVSREKSVNQILAQRRVHRTLSPRLLADSAVTEAFRLQASLLATRRHRALAQVLDAGVLDGGGQAAAYYVTDAPIGTPLCTFFTQGNTDTHLLRWVVLELLEALAALHSPTETTPAAVHADLRDNAIHVTRDPFALRLADYDVCISEGSLPRWPPHLRSRLRSIPSPSSDDPPLYFVPREELSPEIDLHLLQAMLSPHLPSIAVAPGAMSEHEYLVGFLRSLNLEAAPAPDGVPKLRYPSAVEALAALRRGLSSDDATCRAFSPAGYLRVAHGALDSIDDSVRTIIDAPEFQRLRDLSQLGLAKLVYPGACHTRFEHSVSAFRFSLAYLKAILSAPGNHAFRQEVTDGDLACCALAALLHDVGHIPFRHYLGPTPSAPSQEEGALHLLTAPSSSIGASVADVLAGHGSSMEHFLRFFQYSFCPHPREDLPHWYALARVINGPIDVDKLSYLTLDGLHTGLPYAAALDPEALTRNLVAVRVNSHFDLALEDPARIPAELLAVTRYAMYAAVYWHRTVRAFSTMVRRAFELAVSHLDRQAVLARALQLGDKEFLNWLSQELVEHAPSERWLIDDILARKPLRRVLSLRPTIEGATAEGDEGIAEARLYQRIIDASQDRTGSAIRHLEDRFRAAATRVLGPARRIDAVLIDFPGVKQADAGDVRLVHRPSGALIGPGPLWMAIQQNFRVWVAKARIFVKPGFELSCDERRRLVHEMLAGDDPPIAGGSGAPRGESLSR